MINKVTLCGNVGKDPEVRTFGDNKKVASFSLATSESWKDKNGEKQTQVEWHNIVFYDKKAEIVEKYVKKGSQLTIFGKIKYESYEKDGVTKYVTKIVSNEFYFIGKKNETTQQTTQPTQTEVSNDNEEDDLPF